ncbi:site-specific DNA-methyltransferase [Treponema endosymbiont of Eucomonympha sp.]|uniref:site-specific DNA-methyltransferase n=1 Tax=Treponema endosymbiont of Eucomonympha sp. TaxID=1580831 RepID=UPI000785BFFF|nr:site-specific DNA-methyltransferase [Treponema endosymbiont of Eucomonympha sp.]
MNFLIEGDNLAALQLLQKTHKGKIDVIYIDPPYNTGAKDWKYDNDYVDKNDTFRHSKWLSMMEKRLKIAKRMLKKNGVLIVTIDDYELPSITMLLENLGTNTLGRVSICIKPEGRRQSKYFMEAHEYALFVSWGTSPKIRGLDADFGLDFPETDERSKFRWEGLMRRDAGREDRGSDYWYPFYIDKITSEIFFSKKTNTIEMYPINTKGIERVWLWDKQRAIENVSELQAVIRKDKVTLYYKRREMNRVKPTTFWFGSKYNANAYGSRLFEKIIPNSGFDFPKSLYSVLDCCDLFLPENGIALDFFAGSGTTGHAVLELNKQDDGNRHFILCTNNENNICRDITYERIKRVIKKENYSASLKYYKIDFVPISEKIYYEYADKLLLHIRELVELENGVNFAGNPKAAIVLTNAEVSAFFKEIETKKTCRKLYISHDLLLTAEQEAVLDELTIKLNIIPQYYYRNEEES